ncbi:trypsin-like serine protease [Streptomyces sp. NPDC058304]|uniref:trypsin-like serine protease n=1 Tax=Streptomyces sp. NPDC058304 TaxID=3346437 RepID=UPI0036E74CF0
MEPAEARPRTRGTWRLQVVHQRVAKERTHTRGPLCHGARGGVVRSFVRALRTRTTGIAGSIGLATVFRGDRDLVLAKLARSVTGIAPAELAAAAPAQGAVLTAAGFGRTKTDRVPGKVHTGAFDAAAIGTTTVTLKGKSAGSDTVCKGDAGGPAVNGNGEVVDVNSRSRQAGCLGSDPAETRRHAVAVRTDDLGEWVRQTTKVTPNAAGGQQIAVAAVGTSTYLDVMATDGGLHQTVGDHAAGAWSSQWSRVDGAGMTALTSTAANNVVHVYATGDGGRVLGIDADHNAGCWSQTWSQVPGTMGS